MIKTRFAPSPTGDPHIGNIRSALFAYLFAKSEKGKFFLRIEDTDRERYVPGSVERIIESLEWLGIHPDNEELVMQSERLPLYKKAAFDLVAVGKAYICTCSKERLLCVRKEQEQKGIPPHYDRHCRDRGITTEEAEGQEYVIRMKMPEQGKVAVNDLVRGKVEFDLSLIDDQILLKSDGFPTYHLASVVDDHDMGITHVIRAEEWLSSTPKHLILYEMLGWKAPEFAHLSMILGPDRKKLSKRHGASGVMEYKAEGYLPEAIVNFIALLGWNPKTDEEYFSLSDLEEKFRIENLNKAPAVFNIKKLNSYNEYYLKRLIAGIKEQDDKEKMKNFLKDFDAPNLNDGEFELIARGGFATLREMAEYIKALRVGRDYFSTMLIFRKSDRQTTKKALQVAYDELKKINEKEWNIQEIQMKLGLAVERNDLSNGDLFWPVRIALSGEEKSPSPAELAVALGKKETLARVEKAMKKLG